MTTLTADDLAAQIASRCQQARQHGQGWDACCPAHEDARPSLSITPGADKVLLKCFAGCTAAAIVAALGLTLADLFVDAQPATQARRIVTVYDYHDAQGVLLHQTVRYDPKAFKQRRPDPANPGAYIWNLIGIEPVLYHLAALHAAIGHGDTIYLCEGEEDVLALERLGLAATTNPMGADKWRPSYTQTLRGAHVVMLPDNDDPGQKHVRRVTAALHGKVGSLRVVHLPGLETHGDVRDWLQAGGTVAQLQELVAATPLWTPGAEKAAQGTPDVASTEPPARLTTIAARDLYAKDLPELAFIVADILPAGATLFTGRIKDGKSLLAWNLCLAVASGGLALGRYGVRQGSVLYMALEDGERRAQRRLKEQLKAVNSATVPDNFDLALHAPRLGAGLEAALMAWLDAHPNAALVVIDILEKIRPRRLKGGSMYADDYAALEPLQHLCQHLYPHVAILIVHHANKTNPEDFRDTISGANSLGGAADTLWSLKRLAGDADAVLKITGRDVDEQELAMRFDRGFWTVLGDAEAYRLSTTSQAVIEILTTAGKPLTPHQLAQALECKEGTMRKHLKRMHERGEILNLGDGRYIPRSFPPSSSPTHPERERERDGGEKKGESGATNATGATGATGATDATLSGREAGGCHSGATHLSSGKDRELEPQSGRVAGVAPDVQNTMSKDTDVCPKSPEHTHAWHRLSTADFCPWCEATRPRAVSKEG